MGNRSDCATRNQSPHSFNDWGSGDWRVFNLARSRWSTAVERRQFQPVDAIPETANWKVDVSHDPIWSVVDKRSGKSAELLFDTNQYKRPRCFTFLPGKDGKSDRIVIGHRWGMSMFELPVGKHPVLTRIFVGHQGEVTAVRPSGDQQLLISSSLDQTVACWSLADWPEQAELGASFAINSNQLTVQKVANGSPSWDAGLAPGDQIVGLSIESKPIEGGPGAWIARLRNAVPGNTLSFDVRRKEDKDKSDNRDRGAVISLQPTSVRQRPLWVFFPARNNEWVLWRWRDYFYDCSTHGDDYIGWQVSGGITQTPSFTRAEQFRKRFYRPDKIKEMLADIAKFTPTRIDQFEAMLQPEIQISARLDANQDMLLKVQAGTNPKGQSLIVDPVEINLWANEYRVRRWIQPTLPFTQEVRIPRSELRAGPNKIAAQAFSDVGVRADSQQLSFNVSGNDAKPRLIGLCVGISYYNLKRWPNLGFPAVDADSIADALRMQDKNGTYDQVHVDVLRDGHATRQEILKRLNVIAKSVRPSDVFVLFMAGHGFAKAIEEANFGADSFAFVTPKFDMTRPAETGLSFIRAYGDPNIQGDDTLFDMLAKIRSHKFILLDCCHAGASTNVIRSLTPTGIFGPSICVACDKDESAFELISKGHGLFTYAILDTLGKRFEKADLDQNGSLDIHELSKQIEDRVPALVADARPLLEAMGRDSRTSGDIQQTPKRSISENDRNVKCFGPIERSAASEPIMTGRAVPTSGR